jgi:hypothetical protein
MAQNIMQYLNMQRESEDRKRIVIMSKGLAAFTEQKHRIPTEWNHKHELHTGTSDAHASKIDLKNMSSPTDKYGSEPSSQRPLGEPKLPHFIDQKDSIQAQANDKILTHQSVLARASNL